MNKLIYATILISSLSHAKESDKKGLYYGGNEDDIRSSTYAILSPVKIGISTIYIKKEETKLYGLGIDLGLRPVNRKHFDLFVGGSVNAGWTISPKVELQECVRPVYPEREPINKDFSNEPNEDLRKIKEERAKAQEQIRKANDDYNYEVQMFTYNTCKQTKEASENASRYGNLIFYEAGIEPRLKFFKYMILGGFIGKRWESDDKSGNLGSMDLNEPIYRLYIGFEF